MKKYILFFIILSTTTSIIFAAENRPPAIPTQKSQELLSVLVLKNFREEPDEHLLSPQTASPEPWVEVTGEQPNEQLARESIKPEEEELDRDVNFINLVLHGLSSVNDLVATAWNTHITQPMIWERLLKKLTITGLVSEAAILERTIDQGTLNTYMQILTNQLAGRNTRAVEKALRETMNNRDGKKFLLLTSATNDSGILAKISVEVQREVNDFLKKLAEDNIATQTKQHERFIRHAYLLQVLLNATSSPSKSTDSLTPQEIQRRASRSTKALVRFVQCRSRSAPAERSSDSEK